MIKEVFVVSKKVRARSRYGVLAHLMQEVGELAKEVEIVEGFIDAPEGPDGILGEAVDVITCALDLIWLDNPGQDPDYLEHVINTKLREKLNKWLKNKKA